ncbi:MAG: DUF4194 domain-containing protein [Chloroflexota bacterium]
MMQPFAPVIIKLLQGTLEYDDKHWQTLLSYETEVQQYLGQIGLQLLLDKSEGYAYLLQPDTTEDEEPSPLPRLVRRSALTYDATILAVLLREALQLFDTNQPDIDRLVLSKVELQEMIRLFYPEQTDMTRLDRQITTAINQLVKVGFLRKLKSQIEQREQYEVRRIIKAKISADKLGEIQDRLQAYQTEQEVE